MKFENLISRVILYQALPKHIPWNELDEDEIVTFLQEHEILALFYDFALKRQYELRLPSSLIYKLKTLRDIQIFIDQKKINELVHIHEKLAQAKISFLHLAGLSLGHLEYSKNNLRSPRTFEILVKQSDLEKVDNILCNFSLVKEKNKISQDLDNYFSYKKITHRKIEHEIKIYWRLFKTQIFLTTEAQNKLNTTQITMGQKSPLLGDYSLSFEELLEKARPVPELKAFALGPHLALLYISAQLYENSFNKVKMIEAYDIHLLVNSRSSLFLDDCFKEAQKLNLLKACSFALFWANYYFNTTINASWKIEIQKNQNEISAQRSWLQEILPDLNPSPRFSLKKDYLKKDSFFPILSKHSGQIRHNIFMWPLNLLNKLRNGILKFF